MTFPVKVYSMVRFSVTPEVNAASALLILLTVILRLWRSSCKISPRRRELDD